jgi:hypothetical protein
MDDHAILESGLEDGDILLDSAAAHPDATHRLIHPA